MTQMRSHRGEPWNEMADPLAEVAVDDCSVPCSRTALESWATSFRLSHKMPG